MKNFLNKHIWPWTEIHRGKLLAFDRLVSLNEANHEIRKLKSDFVEMSKFFGENAVSVTRIDGDGFKPIRMAYTTGNMKIGVKPGDGKDGHVDINYLYSKPEIFYLREPLYRLKLAHKFTQTHLLDLLRRNLANKIIEDSYNMTKETLFDEAIPE